MQTILLFTDAATSPPNGLAVGAYLCVAQQDAEQYIESSTEILLANLASKLICKEYRSKKSTWSEIKTAIEAIDYAVENFGENLTIEIYTDCQSLCDLLGKRKTKLQYNNFITKTGKILANADIYKELFARSDKFSINAFKIKGHDPAERRLTWHAKIFDIVDKLSRKKLRELLASSH